MEDRVTSIDTPCAVDDRLDPTDVQRLIDEACRRMKADFEEMPDLAVTPEQAARLCGLDDAIAAAALQRLNQRGDLRQSRGIFRRAS